MSVPRMRLPLTLVVLALLGLGLALAANPAGAAPPQPKANWSPCYRDSGFPFECTTVQVPLDHDGPNQGAISIAMIRLPAADPAGRIGSLFLNPGGPGGSGFDFALNVAPFLYTPEVRAHYDIVGFDPRGINRSTAARCFGNPGQWSGALTPFQYPITPEQEAAWEQADLFLVDNCDRRQSRLLDHMSTADVARDLDLLRQAVGDEYLHYAGFSYGSYLGVTYANLFPDKVGAVIVDAILDPVAWATGAPGEGDTIPFSTRLRSDAGAQATLEEFFRLCDAGGPNCAFGPDSAARFAALVARIRAEPVPVPLPDGSVILVTEDLLIVQTLGSMYNSFSWPQLAQLLAFLEFLAPPADVGASLEALWQANGFITKRGSPRYPNLVEGFPGVACADTDNPADYAVWAAAADDAEANFGYFGRIWTWVSSICARWPGSQADRYPGPFDAATAHPVLILNTLYDPATRYEGAVTVAGLLPNSRLVTVDGWGHATLFLSQCADQIVADYLLTGAVPPEDTVCAQDLVPFTFPAGAGPFEAAAEARALVVPAFMPDAVRPPGP